MAEQPPVAPPGSGTATREPVSLVTRLSSRPVALAGLLLGGLLGVVSSAQPWWRAAGGGSSVVFTGTQSTGGLSQALAVVALAGTLLVLVLRAQGRRVVAVLLGLVGIGLVLVGALRLRPSADSVRTRMREVSLIDQYALSPSPWPEVYAVAGLVVVAGSAALAVGAPRWSTSAARFERRGQNLASPAADDPAAIWKALDAGLDPTSAADSDVTSGGQPPDVHIDGTRDTMGANTDEQPSARQQPD